MIQLFTITEKFLVTEYQLQLKEKDLAGNEKLLKADGIAFENEDYPGTVVHVAIDGIYAGCITISDEIRQDAVKAIKDLKS